MSKITKQYKWLWGIFGFVVWLFAMNVYALTNSEVNASFQFNYSLSGYKMPGNGLNPLMKSIKS